MKINIGDKFGDLTVIDYVEPSKDRHKRVLCKCKCGEEQVVYNTHLNNGKITKCKSCAISKSKTQHGLTKTEAYQTWLRIKVRCNNPKHSSYKYYGAKGIKMCKEWENSPEAFCKWFEENKKDDCTVDIIDNNKGYSPENCRFSTI